MSRPRYIFVAEVPAGLRFDVTAETAGRDVQLAFGGPADAPPHVEGAPYKRCQNVVTGRTDHFKLAEEGEDPRSAARAFEATKARDAELTRTRSKRRK